MPDHFTAARHFGKDIASIEQENAFLLVTGKIDTTSETPPLKMGVISVNKIKVYLSLVSSSTMHDTTKEVYSGDGYNLQLEYIINNQGLPTENYTGQIIVTNAGFHSEYKVEGEPGYK